MKNKIILALALVILLLSSAFVLYISLGGDTVIPDENGTVINIENEENINSEDPILGITVDQTEISTDNGSLLVSGIANTYEATVNFKLYTEDDILLVEDFTTVDMPDMGIAGPFEKTLEFEMPSTEGDSSGYLEVFEYSVRDGSQVNTVTVPVVFNQLNTEAMIIVDQDIIAADENALRVSGQASTFEGTVNLKLYGEDGVLIQEDFTTTAGGMGVMSDFEKVIYFAAPLPNIVNGYLEVFEYSARDGSEVNKVTVPVYFAYNDTTELTVFFSHSAPAGMPGECTYLQTVERKVMGTLAVARATMHSMLLGPNAVEEAQGFFSGIPAGTKLNDIYIKNRIAYVDFSSELNSTAGSCGIAGVTAMIRENLLQFSTIDDVVISVEGQTEDILQP